MSLINSHAKHTGKMDQMASNIEKMLPRGPDGTAAVNPMKIIDTAEDLEELEMKLNKPSFFNEFVSFLGDIQIEL